MNFVETLLSKNPALRRSFSTQSGETRVSGTKSESISDKLRQIENDYELYASLK